MPITKAATTIKDLTRDIQTITSTEFDAIKKLQMSNINSQEGFRICITPHYTISSDLTDEEKAVLEEKNQTIMLDYVSKKSITTSSELTTYPMVNGDIVADHMVRQPISMSISGRFSLFGSIATAFSGSSDRITNIEQYFEDLKNNNVLLTISTMKLSTDGTNRFLVRDNMVLTSITWDESSPNLLDYSFDFSEALLIDIDDTIVDYNDDDLPTTTLEERSFTEEVLGFTNLMGVILQTLEDNGYINEDFYQAWLSYYGFETDFGVTGNEVIEDKVRNGSATCGETWWYGFTRGTTPNSQNRNWSRYILVDDEETNIANFESFYNYLMEIYNQLSILDQACSLYSVSSNQNQEILMSIDDEYYSFIFQKATATYTDTNNNETDYSYYTLDVNNLSDYFVGETTTPQAFTSIEAMKTSNCLFKTTSGRYVYFVNMNSIIVDTSETNDVNQSFYEECGDLTNFGIFITTLDMQDFYSTLQTLIANFI